MAGNAPNAAFAQRLQQFLDFYGGKPGTQIDFGLQDGRLGTTGAPGSSTVSMAPQFQQALQNLFARPNDPKAIYAGREALATLLHETLHTRGPYGGGPEGSTAEGGFLQWGDEWQARQLAGSLFPDAAQRFLGVKPGSKTADLYETVGRGSGYTSDLGAPPPGVWPGQRRHGL